VEAIRVKKWIKEKKMSFDCHSAKEENRKTQENVAGRLELLGVVPVFERRRRILYYAYYFLFHLIDIKISNKSNLLILEIRSLLLIFLAKLHNTHGTVCSIVRLRIRPSFA